MGGYITYLSKAPDENIENSGRKRSLDDSDDDERAHLGVGSVQTPTRKRMRTTSNYIYQTLFVNGDNSDVSIIALGKEWRLHKVYLCQCGYFSCMFNGSWKEANQSVIKMSIPDKHIDEEALCIAFGCLYRDDVTIKPSQVVGVLAAACLLQLDGLEERAAEIMMDTVCAKTACTYLAAASMYGQTSVARKCFSWLETNLAHSHNATLLRNISCELMEQLITSSDLVVMQVEMDIYTMLKKWMFLQLTPSWQGASKQLAVDADAFYKQWSQAAISASDGCDGGSDKCEAFLETADGEPFAPVFQCLRYQHIINDTASVKVVMSDCIVPESWLLPHFKFQWLHMLQIEQGKDKGPQEVSVDDFDRESFRCGRVLQKDGEYCWRWTGYHYGVDFLVTYSNKLIVFKRNTTNQSCTNSVSMQHRRSFFYRLSAISLDPFGNASQCKQSGLKCMSLGKDEELVALCLDRNVTFPLYISLSLLCCTPDAELRVARRPAAACTSPRADDSLLDNNAKTGVCITASLSEPPRNHGRDESFHSLRNDSSATLQEQNVMPVDL